MKKNLFLVMLSVVTLSSCSQNDRLEDPAEWSATLGFSTYVGTSTKAVDLVNTTFVEFAIEAYSCTETGFGAESTIKETYIPTLTVSRTYTPADEVGGTAASFSAWSYTDGPYYWPSTYLNFFAYATEGVTDEYAVTYNAPTIDDETTTSSIPTLSYNPGEVVAQQADLVAASAVDKNEEDSNVTGGALQLVFKHILTKINFAVTGAEESATTAIYYDIESITLSGVESDGTYTFGATNTVTGDGSADVNGGLGSWAITPAADVDSRTSYPYYVAPKATADDTAYTEGDPMPERATNCVQTDFTAVTGHSLMLIPQTNDSDVIVTVEYKVYQGTGLIGDYTATDAKSITLDAQVWAAGQNILYNLTLPTGATEIKFTTTELQAWDEANTVGDDGDDETDTDTPLDLN